ncbi:hypothetical protein VNO77_36599 [Canavalia gladiata]|uniref:Uncharacterized protein n=1 Tax=Canavalia gladiata TaxID=3824 RepID=A0AAN9K817_CANGL
MSTGSTTQPQVAPLMGESSVSKQEGGEGDAKINVIEAQEVIGESLECKTPTWSANKIPLIKKCPPAPRKKRRSVPLFSSRMKRSSSTYLVRPEPEEVESFFQSMFELTRVNKSCSRSISKV